VNSKLQTALELVRTLKDMHDIEQDAAKKTRIRAAAADLVDTVLVPVEREVAMLVENSP